MVIGKVYKIFDGDTRISNQPLVVVFAILFADRFLRQIGDFDFHSLVSASESDVVMHIHRAGGLGGLAVQLDLAALDHLLGHSSPLDQSDRREVVVESHSLYSDIDVGFFLQLG